MTPLALVPAALLSFLGGLSIGQSRRNMSMLPPEKRSPLPGVPGAAWGRFVRIMVIAPREHVGPRGRLGYFGLDARRLADVGFMRGAHKATVGGEDGVWTGQWVAPLSLEGYLESAPAQYEALARSMRGLAPAVGSMVGKLVDGERASLSGLLAVGHLAGSAGARSWVADPSVRAKFKKTTDNFHRANNIF
jgi:hypothetical protein